MAQNCPPKSFRTITMSKNLFHISASGSLEECLESFYSATKAITDSLPANAHKSLCTAFLAHYTFIEAMREAAQDQVSPRLENIYEELSSILAESGITLTNHKA